jgi:hypothetical protein
VPGANGQGKTREECLANLREAIALILDHRRPGQIAGSNFPDGDWDSNTSPEPRASPDGNRPDVIPFRAARSPQVNCAKLGVQRVREER